MLHVFRLTFVLFLLLLPLSTRGLANDHDLSNEDEKELSQLLQLLDKHTDIATKTKMNADYIPGMVTVLYGKDLEARGKRNLMEALTLVPGIDLTLTANGTPALVSRGIGSPYISATSMILLNGTPLNTTLFGFATGICNMPIEQIDRIEIIRGPGAAVHGEFAYSGVINIITREEDSRLFATAGRNKSYAAGAMAHFTDKERDFHLSVNGAYSDSEGQSHFNGPDSFGNYGNSNEARDNSNAFVTLKYKDFTFLANYINEGAGDFYAVQPIPDDHTAQEHIYQNIEARQLFRPAADFDIQFKMGWQSYSYDADEILIAPPGADLTLVTGYTYPDGIKMSISSQEEKFFSCLENSWTGLADHTILTGFSYNHIELKDVWQKSNVDIVSWAPMTWQKVSSADLFVDKNSSRDLVSLMLQDVWKVTSSITLTTGLRGDHYNDVGDNVTPRISAVWQPFDHHIFKAQAARAYRPPTFMELYGSDKLLQGNPDIDPETIDTYEVGYIHRKEHHTSKFTLFYSRLNDLITTEPNGTLARYTNSDGAKQMGFEMELEQDILNNLKFDGNLSYAHTKDIDSGKEVVGSIKWQANAALIYQPASWTSLACQYRFVDRRTRAVIDPRDDLKGYDKVDLTLSFFPSNIEGLTLRTGVQNIFNEEILNPSSSVLNYGDDFETQDRYWWAQCSYEF
ncbi:MAG: TonB-dependent receptor [Proteobacteria bacterium]|nr:TonB-dependent receptor [Pseudomonadota bacterium]MBU1641690.1 TonB-dependent receptor [Pseudomonadota bacterium]